MSDTHVTLLAHALPVDVASRLSDRARWLCRQLPTLDQELAVACPPIAIVPACWFTTIGREHVLVAGRATVREVGRRPQLIVEITAPTLLEYDDDFVVGVIAHEFLHVVEETIHRNRADRLRDWFGMHLPRPVLSGYGASWECYRRLDRALQAPPDLWLSERLQRLQARVENEPQDEAEGRVTQAWLGRALPVDHLAVDSLAIHVASLWLDPAIIARQDALLTAEGSLRRSQAQSVGQTDH